MSNSIYKEACLVLKYSKSREFSCLGESSHIQQCLEYSRELCIQATCYNALAIFIDFLAMYKCGRCHRWNILKTNQVNTPCVMHHLFIKRHTWLIELKPASCLLRNFTCMLYLNASLQSPICFIEFFHLLARIHGLVAI